ncbi:hypothetical protein BofuT4_uP150930.1 [Botrytis cinerea T4]|uniref:Uncharacterized protein n=1 Tax=Botryotinia fuckeliana (strain T4) TaxID=999810 RepID=G2YWG3_BOTF4|nr:hypothetical protein BofuT4_uP150930.1 [Botrytis cinerea T4]
MNILQINAVVSSAEITDSQTIEESAISSLEEFSQAAARVTRIGIPFLLLIISVVSK